MLVDERAFLNQFSTGTPTAVAVSRLHGLLTALEVSRPLAAQCEWLEDLIAWLFERGRAPGQLPREHAATARLRLLLVALEAAPESRAAVRALVAQLFAELSMVRLFTDTGLPTQLGFFAETFDRLMKNVVPEPPVERDGSRLLFRLFPTRQAASWFEGLSPALHAQLFEMLAVPSGPARAPMLGSMRDAAVLLAVRISAHGTADDVRARSPMVVGVRASPFLQLSAEVRKLVDPADGESERGVTVRESIGACRKVILSVIETLDHTGISIDLVYRLEYLKHLLDRLYALLPFLAPPAGAAIEGAGLRLVYALIRGGVRDRSLSEVVRANSRLLALRVIERAGRTGEHYITRTRAEQHQMITSAGGGGVITGGSVLLKFFIGWAHLPVLLEGLTNGLNYGVGFVAMQLFGFTLATKQPSMTAAALAGAIKETTESRDLTPLVDQVEATMRSQLAAALGNVGMVALTVIVIDSLCLFVLGHHVLDAAYADKLIKAHHPLHSATLLYAALTGVYLWLASVLGGMVENWFVMSQLPEAIATSRSVRRVLGRERALWLSEFSRREIAGFGSNLGLGLILGLVPALFSMVGVPIEVRHITFATGQLTFAGLQRGVDGLHADFAWAASSLLLIASLNFAVSFSLALFVAFRARDVKAGDQVRLALAVLRRFRSRPLDFIRAPLEVSRAPHPGEADSG